MNVRALRKFFEEQIEDAKKSGVLLSLHLKATMMKVSDPVMFGHAVTVFFKDVFDEARGGAQGGWASTRTTASATSTRRSSRCRPTRRRRSRPTSRPSTRRAPRSRWWTRTRASRTCTSPNDIIVDASMPVVVRESGKMWGPDGKLHDTKAMIPDRCYATIYKTIIEDCKKHGAFNPATMGSVPERRPHGAEGGGVRLARQDLHRHGGRDDPRGRRLGRDAPRAEGRGGRHLPDVPGEGHRDPRLGQARRHAREGHRRAGRLLARQEPRPRRAGHREGREVPRRPRHEGARHPHPGAGGRDEVLARADPAGQGHDLGHRQRAA